MSLARIQFIEPDQEFRMTKILIQSFTSFVFYALVATSVANAQALHHGRITRSFTEPVEKTVSASAEPGVIQIAHIKEGDFVGKGDLLATLNHNVLQKSLAIAVATAEATARLDAAVSQHQLTKSQLEAVNSLVRGGHTNRFEVEQKQAESERAYAELRAAQDELKLAGLEVKRIEAQIEDRKIRSKINGFVTEIHKQPGEHVSANEPHFATVVRVDQLKVRFYLDAQTLANTKTADQVQILIGEHRSRTDAVVTYVSPIIDPDSGLGRLDVRIENSDYRVQSGTVCFWNDHIAPRSDALRNAAASEPNSMLSPRKR